MTRSELRQCLVMLLLLLSTAATLAVAASAVPVAGSPRLVPVLVGLRHPPSGLRRLQRCLERASQPNSPQYGEWLDEATLKTMLWGGPAGQRKAEARFWQHTLPQLRRGFGAQRAELRTHDMARLWLPVPQVDLLREAVTVAQPGSPLYALDSVFGESSATGEAKDEHRVSMHRYRATLVRPEQQMGTPSAQRAAYGIPESAEAPLVRQQVWGPGTYGYLESDLVLFNDQFGGHINVSRVDAPLFKGQPGGDNWGEGTLDTQMISSIAINAHTAVVNSNTSASTEETTGFGYAFVDHMNTLANQSVIPHVLSLSLGSLSFHSCQMLCTKAQDHGVSASACADYIATQRQVCMMDAGQTQRIDVEFQKLGVRGTTVVAAAGDGGSHFSFVPFPSDAIGSVLNTISCRYNFPTFPASSPHVLAVGGTQWTNGPSQPVHWTAGGAGFSWVFARPAYQAQAVAHYLAAVNTTQGFPAPGDYAASGRAYPDISALAIKIPVVMQGKPMEVGGTSASAPEMAAVISLLNQVRLAKGKPSLGFVNPALYAAAAKPGQTLTYDVTSGNTNCQASGSCCDTGFVSAPGWDAVTGWGSPRWEGLVNALTQ